MVFKSLLNFLKAQNKIKLIIYVLGFTFFVLINNAIYNSIIYPFYDKIIYNDLKYGFGSLCFHEQRLRVLPYCFAIKVVLFLLLWFMGENGIKKYIKEILILYFLFDIGEIGGLIVFKTLHFIFPPYFPDFNFYFYSDFEMLAWDIGDSVYTPYIVALIWSIIVAFYLWKNSKLNFNYLAKRFLILPLSVVLYAFGKYYFWYKLFVWN